MNTETKFAHTPTPWRVGDAGHTVFGPKIDPYPYEFVSPTIIASNIRNSDNAAFIVRAVNCHDDMLQMLKAALQLAVLTRQKNFAEDLKAVIAKAEGKK